MPIFLLFLIPLAGCGGRSDDSNGGSQIGGTSGVQDSTIDPVSAAREAFKDRDYSTAQSLLSEYLIAHPNQAEATFLLAQVAAARGDSSLACDLASEIEPNHPRFGWEALQLLVEQSTRCGRESLAMDRLKPLVDRPNALPRLRHLSWKLFRDMGRWSLAADQAQELSRLGEASFEESLSLIRRHCLFQNGSAVDADNLLSAALVRFGRSEYAESLALLDKQYQTGFLHPEAAGLYGRCLAEAQMFEDLEAWLVRCKPEARGDANYWAAVGVLLADRGNVKEAIGATLEAVRRNPTDRVSYQRLASWFRAIDDIGQAEQFAERGVLIAQTEKISGWKERVFDTGLMTRQPERQSEMVQLLLEIGRPIEALQWSLHRISPSDVGQRQAVMAKLRQLSRMDELSQMLLTNIFIGVDPTQFDFEVTLSEVTKLAANSQPERSANALAGNGPPERNGPLAGNGPPKGIATAERWRIRDIAEQTGLDFRLLPKDPGDSSPLRIHEALGSGIAVLDFDQDGRPDVYFGQAGSSPPSLGTSDHSNVLFRNVSGRFEDITVPAGLPEFGYTFGIAVGDINQDGFDDLFVGNLGVNRLLINNGDGTFHDATTRLGSQRGPRYQQAVDSCGKYPFVEGVFTTSVAIADLNGDQLPDLFESNYVELDGLFVRRKPDADGRVMQKTPLECYAEPDRCWFQNDDGQFVRSDMSKTVGNPGTGLGLIAGNLDGVAGNEVFVANDGRENHWLGWTPDGWVDRAGLLGIANNAEGVSCACMGIATFDVNRDASLDFFVTNFYSESANLYVQTKSGGFRDLATRYQLASSTRRYVGFGCKAVDVNRDGWSDLIVTNGHVDPLREGPFEMPPQCLVRDGAGFVQARPVDPSGYWSGRYAGRSMVTLDSNLDGQLELIVNHLDRPAALLFNETQAKKPFIQIELAGSRSERNAVGARVDIEGGSADRVSGWSVAGDGYLASDERVLAFAVSPRQDDGGVTATVTWPSGRQQKFDNLTVDSRWMLIENQEPWLMWQVDPSTTSERSPSAAE